MEKRYYEIFSRQKVVVMGVEGPPWIGSTVHMDRVRRCLDKQRNEVYFFDVRVRAEIFIVFAYQIYLFWCLLWWQPHAILFYVSAANCGIVELAALARWKRLFSAKFIVIEHSHVPFQVETLFYKKQRNSWKNIVDQWVYIGPTQPAPSVREELPASLLVCESEYIDPDLALATMIRASYPLAVRTFIKVRSPLLVMSFADFKKNSGPNNYNTNHIIEVMIILRGYYEHIGLIWAVGSVSDIIVVNAIKERFYRNQLDGFTYIFQNEQQFWPLLRVGHLYWCAMSTSGTALQEALLCTIPVVATVSASLSCADRVFAYRDNDVQDCVRQMLTILPKRGRRKIPIVPFEYTALKF